MKELKANKIMCPCCGAEYLPGEIYLPKEFLGQPTEVERDHVTGKIMSFFGSDMNLREEYICDYCNTPFRVKSKVQFFTQECTDQNFNKDYETKLTKTSLFMSEC